MKTKIVAFASLFSLLFIAMTACQNVKEISDKAYSELAHGDYDEALFTLLDLNDATIEQNDSIFRMLSEAYFGSNPSFEPINAGSISDMDFSSDKSSVWFSDLWTSRVLEYSYPDLMFQKAIETRSPAYGIDLSPDGNSFAAALSDNGIDIIDTHTGNLLDSLSGHTNRVRDVVFLDSNRIASGGNDQEVKIWDLKEHKILDSQWRHRKNVKSLTKSADGKYFVSASNDGTAIVWQVSDSGTLVETAKVAHGRNYVNAAALSPDNKILVTVSGDGDAKVWDAKSGALQKIISIGEAGASVDFSPNGKYVAIGGSAYVYVLDTNNWNVEFLFPIRNEPVWSLKFLDNDTLVFVDSSRFYEYPILSRKALIEKAKESI